MDVVVVVRAEPLKYLGIFTRDGTTAGNNKGQLCCIEGEKFGNASTLSRVLSLYVRLYTAELYLFEQRRNRTTL